MSENKDLKSRIAAANPGYNPDKEAEGKAMGTAMRAGVELVSAVAVGAFIGYWIDQWLGTSPFGMIILFFLGFAAGFLNIYKAQTGNYHKTGIGQLTNTEKNGQKDAEKPEK